MNEKIQLALAILLGLSEVLALIPSIQANSVFQLIFNVLKKVAPEKKPEQPEEKKE